MDNTIQNDGYEGKVAAVLDTHQLVMRCLQLEKDLQSQVKRNAEQAEAMTVLDREKERLTRFADIGQGEIERKKKDALSQLRAIVHFTGDRERLQTVERLFADSEMTPGEIAQWHRTIVEEFRSLYPNRPASRMENDPETDSHFKQDWDAFRICPS